jgi:hypothetical protein
VLVDHHSYILQLRRDHGLKYRYWSEVPKKIIPEAEARAKAVDKGVVEKWGKGRGLRGPGVADDEAGSVQPELW